MKFSTEMHFACTLLGSVATKFRWGERFYSTYVRWSFLMALQKKMC